MEKENFFKKGKFLFEREFLNWKQWNERAKEFDNWTDNLSYKGEYLNGQKIEKEKNMMMVI